MVQSVEHQVANAAIHLHGKISRSKSQIQSNLTVSLLWPIDIPQLPCSFERKKPIHSWIQSFGRPTKRFIYLLMQDSRHMVCVQRVWSRCKAASELEGPGGRPQRGPPGSRWTGGQYRWQSAWTGTSASQAHHARLRQQASHLSLLYALDETWCISFIISSILFAQ